MHTFTGSQTKPIIEAEGDLRLGNSTQEKRSGNLGYAERRDLQHQHVWDQEKTRITFAEMPSAEEMALSRLFEQARKNSREKLEPEAQSMNVSCYLKTDLTPVRRVDFSPPPLDYKIEPQTPDLDELVGLETLTHVESYEKLLRTTSYKMLEAHAGNFKDIPVNENKRFDASLQKIIDSADRAASKARSQSLRFRALRHQASLSTDRRSSPSARQLNFGKLRIIDEHCASRANWCFGGSEVRDVLQNIWNRFVAKKNASLMLEVLQRKMRKR